MSWREREEEEERKEMKGTSAEEKGEWEKEQTITRVKRCKGGGEFGGTDDDVVLVSWRKYSNHK